MSLFHFVLHQCVQLLLAVLFLPSASLKKQMPCLAWRQESTWPSSGSLLRVEEKTGVWGPCWGKKAKNPPRGREELRAQRTEAH